MTGPFGIGAIGMASPVGLSWTRASAAMRAGIVRRVRSPFLDDAGKPIVASMLRSDELDRCPASARWAFFAAHAAVDVALEVGIERFTRMPVLLVAPGGESHHARVSTQFTQALDVVGLTTGDVRVVGESACDAVRALEAAGRTATRDQPCVVLAADSLASAQRLLPFEKQRRLLVEGNADGFVPGEAAVALVVGGRDQDVAFWVRGTGWGQEPSTLFNDVPLRAEGLIAATRTALAQASLDMRSLDFRLSDAAGESFHFKEQPLLVSRLLSDRKPDFPLWLCAETLGYTGAAAGLCAVAYAAAAWHQDFAPGPRALVCVGDDAGGRAALVVEKGAGRG